MKFIKISDHKEVFFENLREHPESLAGPLQDFGEWMQQMKDEGKLVDAYFIPGLGRSITIWEFNDENDIDNNILQDPMELDYESQFFPAVPLFQHMENAMKRKA